MGDTFYFQFIAFRLNAEANVKSGTVKFEGVNLSQEMENIQLSAENA